MVRLTLKDDEPDYIRWSGTSGRVVRHVRGEADEWRCRAGGSGPDSAGRAMVGAHRRKGKKQVRRQDPTAARISFNQGNQQYWHNDAQMAPLPCICLVLLFA